MCKFTFAKSKRQFETDLQYYVVLQARQKRMYSFTQSFKTDFIRHASEIFCIERNNGCDQAICNIYNAAAACVCVEQKTKNQRGEEEDHPLSNCHFAPLVLFYNTSNLKIHCHPPPPLYEWLRIDSSQNAKFGLVLVTVCFQWRRTQHKQILKTSHVAVRQQ